MCKLFFILSLAVGVVLNSNAQYCTPDPNACVPDPNLGVCATPYPELVLEINQYVDTVIHVISAPTYMGSATVDEVMLDNITNIPTGLNFELDATGGNWVPDPNYPNVGPFGCIRLYGIPTVLTGPTDSVLIEATVTITMPPLGQIALPQTIGYRVVVQQTTNRADATFGNVSCYVSSSNLHIKSSKNADNLPLLIKVMDVYGRTQRQLQIPINELSNQFLISLEDLAHGIYMLQLQQGEAIKSVKFKY